MESPLRICVSLSQALCAVAAAKTRRQQASPPPPPPLVGFAHRVQFSPPRLGDLVLLTFGQRLLRLEGLALDAQTQRMQKAASVMKRSDFGAYRVTRVIFYVFYEETYWENTNWQCPHDMRYTQLRETSCWTLRSANYKDACRALTTKMMEMMREGRSFRVTRLQARVTVRNTCPVRCEIDSRLSRWKCVLIIPALRLDGDNLGRCLQFKLWRLVLEELRYYHGHVTERIMRRLLASTSFYQIDSVRLRRYYRLDWSRRGEEYYKELAPSRASRIVLDDFVEPGGVACDVCDT